MTKRAIAKRNAIRVIAGNLRSRKILFPDLPDLRPTSDRIRETLFNWLQHDIREATCLDLFAGSGALGIEALSRGAERVVFVEKEPEASDAIRENLARLEIGNAAIYCTEAERWMQQNTVGEPQFGIVFLDPPFADDRVYRLCSQLDDSSLLKSNSKIYVETPFQLAGEALPGSWTITRSKSAGAVHYCLLERRQEYSDIK